MWVSITAMSSKGRDGSGGKSMSLSPASFDINFVDSGANKVSMYLTATASETTGTGERLGATFQTRRSLTVSFDHKDLTRIVRAVIARGFA